MSEPIDLLFSTPLMSAAFSPEAHVQGMLAFEAALARAESRAGIIPQEAAAIIEAHCRVELFDVAALYREAAMAGTPAIPLVRMLTAQVEGDAQKFVHWGATSQDAIDTAMMLQMRDGLDLLVDSLHGVCAACATLAAQHRHTLMSGRTLLQQALPITFGLKAARWLAFAVRQVHALRERRERTLAVQLGGAAGTLASLGDKGLQVVEKHNPVDATGAIASARLAVGVVPVILSAMAQEHERAVGGWQAEWAAIPGLFRFTASAVERVRGMIGGLQIEPAHMRANLALTGGLIMAESLTMALAPHVGRPEAHRIVQAACDDAIRSGMDLRQAALAAQVRAHLSPEEIDRALDPGGYLGSTDTFIDRALASYREVESSRGGV
ncbi:MAG: 3-carboxy-cis,cis-muconate cycloisomerase [Chloroflexi bacterium]|nr:MAG: 3-carboxy-cis,cis-muconate cycloisomerase [Chloroflexota bacterium]